MRYDRAGFGKSDFVHVPYTIDSDVDALERGLRALRVKGCIVLVAHSYGGFIATRFAAKNPAQVCGMVLVDANLAPFFTAAQTDVLMSNFKSARETLLSKNPALVRVLDAFPDTVARMREQHLPRGLTVIDIVSEHPPFESAAEVDAWHAVHSQFVAGDPARRAIEATGSGHFIMRDKPELVISAVDDLCNEVIRHGSE